MNPHFAYLLADKNHDFFQKVAFSAVPAWQAPAGFEKFAQELDRDIGILKTAAARSGDDLAMSHRADAYVDTTLLDLEADQFGGAFDKVASAAIETDIDRARREFYKLAGNQRTRAWVNDRLNKLGYEMAKLAEQEKRALLAGLLARGAAAKAGAKAFGTKALAAPAKGWAALKAAPTALKSGVKAVGRGIAAPFRGAANVARRARLGMASGEIKGIRNTLAKPGMAGDVAKMSPGKAAYKESLEQSLKKGKENVRGLMQNPKYREAVKARNVKNIRSAQKVQGAERAELARVEKAKAKTEAGRADAAVQAADAAAPPVAPAAPAAASTGTKGGKKGKKGKKGKQDSGPELNPSGTPLPENTAPASGEVKEKGFFHPAEKAIGSGYKSLSAEEKADLWKKGLGGALGYRMLTGKGAVTGGEGVI